MNTPDPFAPMTPAQEADLIALLAAGRGRNSRNRLRSQLAGLSVDGAARKLAELRGEPAPVERRLDMEPAPAPANPAAVREATRRALESHFSGYALHARIGRRRS